MRKAEKEAICDMIARWEWSAQGGSSISEAMALGRCSEDLKEAFNLTDADLSFARSWEICQKAGIERDSNTGDAIDDLASSDYQTLCDLIDAHGFEGLPVVFPADTEGATKP